MKQAIFLVFTILILISSCDNIQKAPNLPKHIIYDEEVYDQPTKTQISLNVVIQEDTINKDNLRQLLMGLYEQTKDRSGFKHHPNPTSVYIYAYTSKEKAASGMGQWIAMLGESHRDTKPSIDYNDIQFKSLSEPKDMKWGLSFEKRQTIWNDLIRSEDRANQKAEKKYPISKGGATMDEINRNTEYSNQLSDEYAQEIAEKHEIEVRLLDSISKEGLSNGWAFPEYE